MVCTALQGVGPPAVICGVVADRARVVAVRLANKTALLNEFVQRPEFKQLYPDSLTNTQFVNLLFDTAGLIPFTVERQQQIDAMNSGKTRAGGRRVEIRLSKIVNTIHRLS